MVLTMASPVSPNKRMEKKTPAKHKRPLSKELLDLLPPKAKAPPKSHPRAAACISSSSNGGSSSSSSGSDSDSESARASFISPTITLRKRPASPTLSPPCHPLTHVVESRAARKLLMPSPSSFLAESTQRRRTLRSAPTTSLQLLPGSEILNRMVNRFMYINLEHRIDRDLEMRMELDRVGVDPNKVIRIEAVNRPEFGAVGCALSHIRCLELALKHDWETILILEDDFDFCAPRTFAMNMKALQSQLPKRWDVVLFSAGFQAGEPHSQMICRVFKAFSTAGYMIRGRENMVRLRKNFMEAVQKLEEHGMEWEEKYAIDRYWSKLQKTGYWYTFIYKCGSQRRSYSDIEGKMVNYGH